MVIGEVKYTLAELQKLFLLNTVQQLSKSVKFAKAVVKLYCRVLWATV